MWEWMREIQDVMLCDAAQFGEKFLKWQLASGRGHDRGPLCGPVLAAAAFHLDRGPLCGGSPLWRVYV